MVVRRKPVDYHVHSNFSCDGKSAIFEMCRRAVDLKITEIGFSEHVDFDPRNRWFGFFNYGGYTSEIESAREAFRDQLIVRKGVEIDCQHYFEGGIERWLRDKEFDFTIGSVHYLDHDFICRPLRAHFVNLLFSSHFSDTSRLFFKVSECTQNFLVHGRAHDHDHEWYMESNMGKYFSAENTENLH